MKIMTPDFAADSEDQGMQVFFAFMYRIAQREGFKKIRYYIEANDVRQVTQKFIINPERQFDRFDQWASVGRFINHVWTFQWRKKPDLVWVDITEPGLCAVWGYLIGLEQHEVLTEEYRGVTAKEQKHRLEREDLQFFQYFGLERYDRNNEE